MCNKLHRDSEEIPEKGFGWKVFVETKDGTIRSMINEDKYGPNPEVKYVKYESYYFDIKEGFCFCLSKIAALQLRKDWENHSRPNSKTSSYVIRKIKYKEGLGKHIENMITNKHENHLVALCKQFKIIKED